MHISFRFVTSLVADMTKKVKVKQQVVLMPRNGDVPFTHANVTLARKELGYRPSTDLETGLGKFVQWYLSFMVGRRVLGEVGMC
ncbi:putative UDP-glucuronate 4-epimerase [Helianthus anomalus]